MHFKTGSKYFSTLKQVSKFKDLNPNGVFVHFVELFIKCYSAMYFVKTFDKVLIKAMQHFKVSSAKLLHFLSVKKPSRDTLGQIFLGKNLKLNKRLMMYFRLALQLLFKFPF